MNPFYLIKLVTLVFTTLVLSACGGGGGSSDIGNVDSSDIGNIDSTTNSSTSIKVGVIRDSAIHNLNYSSCDPASASCVNGLTDANGSFQYYEGSSVEFLIGNLQVAQAQGEALLTPESFVSTEEEVINFASFFLGLDEDGNPNNGIKISSQSHVLASSNVNDQNISYIDRAQLEKVANRLNVELVSEQASLDHLEKNKLLQYGIAKEDRFALALVNKKNYSGCCNLKLFDKSPSARVKYEVWQSLLYDLISSSELNNAIEEIKKQKEVADAVLNFTETAVSLVGNVLSVKAGLVEGADLEFYINSIQAAKSGLNLIITATYNGVQEEFTIDLEKNPGMIYAMTGMDVLSLGNIGGGVVSTAQVFSEDGSWVNSEVVNNVVKPLMDTAISETMVHIAKQGTKGALVKGVASRVIGKLTVVGLAIDVAKIAKDLYFAKQLMNSRIDNESRLMAFDYLRAYYEGAGNDAWMDEKYGFSTEENATLKSLSAGYHKDWTDVTLEVLTSSIKLSFNYAMFGPGVFFKEEPIYEDVDEIRRQQAAQLIAAYHNKIESFYTKISVQLGGVPSDDGSISTDGKFYTLQCSGTSDLVMAQIETFGLPWNLDDPNTLSWLVPDGVRKESINDDNNPVIYHFDRPGVFSIGAKLKKLNSDVTYSHYQNYVVLNCAEVQNADRYHITAQEVGSVTYSIKMDFQSGFIGWYDQDGQLLTTKNSYQYLYANYNSIKKITPVWDVSLPVITLNGSSILEVEKGQSYSDPGATAFDNIDGDISSQIVVGGDAVNTDSVASFTVTYNVTDAAGNVADEVTRLVNVTEGAKVTAVTPTGKLNDTGITWGGNYPSGNNADCTGETIGQQDCSHGRDALAAAGQLTKVGGGDAGFDFTKLDANGNPLADQTQDYATQPWSCVKDNHTGLIWEVKTPDAQGTNLHSMNDTFNWYNTNTATNGGASGSEGNYDMCTGYISGEASSYCNTQAFVAKVNTAGLCGATDWRLPNIVELASIVHLGKSFPAIDGNYFPNSDSGFYWSSSPYAYFSDFAWGVYFVSGNDYDFHRNGSLQVRVVRSGQ